MRQPALALAVPILLLIFYGTGCGVQDQLLGTTGGLLFQGFDTLAKPGQSVRVVAELRGGNYLSGLEGYMVGFYDRDHELGRMRTDESGRAWIEFMPHVAGQVTLLARLEDPDVRQFAVEAVEILVEVRPGDAPMVILDLDHTLVDDDFEGVLTGQGDPMPHSLAVVERLARDHGIIYLTGRPTAFSELSKRWLRKNNYPLGPVLTHGESALGLGVESYKTVQVQALHREYPNLRYGIGDLISDIRAYRSADMHAILILHPELMTDVSDVLRWLRDVRRLPQEVDVVENWQQVEDVIFRGARYPATRAAAMLEQLVQQRIEDILQSDDPPHDPPAASEAEPDDAAAARDVQLPTASPGGH